MSGRVVWTNEGVACIDRLRVACRGGDGNACTDAGNLLVNGLGGVPRDPEAALRLESDACEDGVADACVGAGVLLESGLAGVGGHDSARDKFTRACELGVEAACRKSKALGAATVPTQLVADANLRVGDIEADGLALRELACAVDDGPPMLGALVVVASLAKQRKAIDKCAPKGQAFAVTWTFVNGKVRSPVVTGGSAGANACVAKALVRAAGAFDARCGALLLAGKRAGAEATLEAARLSRSGG